MIYAISFDENELQVLKSFAKSIIHLAKAVLKLCIKHILKAILFGTDVD